MGTRATDRQLWIIEQTVKRKPAGGLAAVDVDALVALLRELKELREEVERGRVGTVDPGRDP